MLRSRAPPTTASPWRSRRRLVSSVSSGARGSTERTTCYTPPPCFTAGCPATTARPGSTLRSLERSATVPLGPVQYTTPVFAALLLEDTRLVIMPSIGPSRSLAGVEDKGIGLLRASSAVLYSGRGTAGAQRLRSRPARTTSQELLEEHPTKSSSSSSSSPDCRYLVSTLDQHPRRAISVPPCLALLPRRIAPAFSWQHCTAAIASTP